MDYFYYTYKNNHIEFSSHIYKISTYHYNWHDETELLILLKGELEMSCHTDVFHMEPMDVVVISPQVGHATLALEPDTMAMVVHVGREFFRHFDKEFPSYQFVIRSTSDTRHNEFYTALRQYVAQLMLHQCEVEGPLKNILMERDYASLGALLYERILDEKTVEPISRSLDASSATFDKMIAYIDDNYQNKIELEDIANIGGYHVGYASQFFKRQMGVTFMEYLLRLRLREATVRLVNSDEAIARIANRVGFPDIKAFNVAFKKQFHTTPSEYRKTAQAIGRETKLHDWKEIVSTGSTDIVDILQTMTNKAMETSPMNATQESSIDTVKDLLQQALERLNS